MISLLATNSLTEVPAFVSWAKAMPQIATAASVNDSPWLYSALTQVREIEAAGELIPGLGDLRIGVQTAMRARKLLSSVEMRDLPAPIVAPVSGGGLSIVWSLGPREVKLSFDPGGEIVFFTLKDDEILDDGLLDVTTRSPITAQLKWMLETGV